MVAYVAVSEEANPDMGKRVSRFTDFQVPQPSLLYSSPKLYAIDGENPLRNMQALRLAMSLKRKWA